METREGLQALTRAIRAEADGKALRKELAKNMRESLKPSAAEAKSAIMGMGSTGPGTSPALRSSIAKKIRPEVKLGGRWTGARIKAFKTKNVRGFPNAPKRTNRPRGWRHLVYGRPDSWVTQHGKSHWFDESMDGAKFRATQAVTEAMSNMADRIAARNRQT
ncbi:hypothetical protein AB0J25_11835 [Streptomyces sp. NPDC049910]|uniref:hypothetical protein n=1 Tax=Streptomyces sp. NPDC049910 TaxID=3155278 RepID=UPI0034145E86